VMAIYWFKKAAEQGDPSAQLRLEILYISSEEFGQQDPDPVIGKTWISKAAEQNMAEP